MVLPLFHKIATTTINAKNERIRSGIIATFTIDVCKGFFNIATSSVVSRSFFLKSLVEVEIIKGREKVGLLWVGLIPFQILRVN